MAGDYDWEHLAIHLWPERVVPKCAEDRSLRAHGLEEVFWVEGADGNWQPHKVDQATIDRLIKERTSAAVKDALKAFSKPQCLRGAACRAPRVRVGSHIQRRPGLPWRGPTTAGSRRY